SYFSVSGAVLSDKAVIDPLTSALPLLWQRNNEKIMLSLSRTFRALKKSLQLLDQYYDQVDQSNSQIDNLLHPSFPKVTIDYKSYNVQINFQIGGYLLWEVKLIEKQGSYEKAYVKAVQNHHYSIDTHQHLAQVGYAPKVLAISSIPGNWLLVYMECLDNHSTLNHIASNLNQQERNSLGEKIEKAVKYLHDSGHVHGDLREGNIMIHKLEDNDFDIKLIDFEWSGKVGFARYSHFMNRFGIKWADGADDGELVTQTHNLTLLNLTFQKANLKIV
ncbi:15593_t:CDS:1, partial [Funneliformis caledonium]